MKLSNKAATRLITTLAAAVALCAGFLIGTAPANAAGTTYYVDCSQAADGNGTLASPWNALSDPNGHVFAPGDQLLLKSGTTCTGTLQPQGSGTSAAPITMGPYGTGSAPVVDGAGAGSAVRLLDVSYWTVTGLKVTNPASQTAERRGILVESSTTADKAGIVITDDTVDGVAGWGDKTGTNSSWFVYSAGIEVVVDGSTVGHFDGVTITNNTVTNTGGGGIKIAGDTSTYNTDVYIAHNSIRAVGGDGIVVHDSESPLIEYNTAYDLGLGTYPFVAGNFAGMWAFNSHSPTFQYNVVGASRPVTYDATAWDCDTSVTGTCLYQYNYSFGNAGGFYLDCISGCGSATTTATIVLRYNVAQDDCRVAGADGGPGATQIYNNTFFCPDRPFQDDMTANKQWTNNLIVAPSGTFKTTGNTFTSNSFYGGIAVPAGATSSVTTDPGLFAPGSGQESLNLAGYRLAQGSPALNAGTVVANNGGRDFFGNSVSATAAPNIGAYAAAGASRGPQPLSQLFNSVGVTSDSDPSTGAIALSGRSFSAEALTAAGAAPGSPLTVGGFGFVWHPTAVGRPDNVKTAGQVVALSGSGSSLGFLGASTSGTTTGSGTITYSDGTTQAYTLSLSDWWDASPRFGNTLAVKAAYQNIRSSNYNGSLAGPYAQSASVWVAAIPLDASKTVVSVTLPAGDYMADAGIHIFDIRIKS